MATFEDELQLPEKERERERESQRCRRVIDNTSFSRELIASPQWDRLESTANRMEERGEYFSVFLFSFSFFLAGRVFVIDFRSPLQFSQQQRKPGADRYRTGFSQFFEPAFKFQRCGSSLRVPDLSTDILGNAGIPVASLPLRKTSLFDFFFYFDYFEQPASSRRFLNPL